MVSKLVFIRHGNTGYHWGTFVGSTDVPLVKGALEDAKEIGERLKPEGVELIYTSRLQRAWRTAEAIGKVLGLKPVRLKDLNEIDFGEWELKKSDDVKKGFPDLWKERLEKKWDFKYPGGELSKHARARVMKVVSKLLKKEKTIAIVAHGSLFKMIYSSLLNVPIEGLSSEKYPFLYTVFFKKDGNKIVVEKTWP